MPFQDERNKHVLRDECQKASESTSFSESYSGNEKQPSQEFIPIGEYKEESGKSPNPKKKKSNSQASLLAKHLSAIAITLSAAVVIGVASPFLPSSAADPGQSIAEEIALVSVQNEIRGLRSYGCKLRFETQEYTAFTAILTNQSGEILSEIPLTAENFLSTVSLEALSPETDYTLTVFSADNEKLLTHSFSTDSPFTLGTEANGIIPLQLHEDILSSFDMDYAIRLLDSEGKDFSSNLRSTELGADGLFTLGLYDEKYTLLLELYHGDDVERYEKTLSLGNLTPIVFEIMALDTSVSLSYVSGDMNFYNGFSIELSNDTKYYNISDSDVYADALGITATLPASFERGDYTLSVWGYSESDSITLYNQIYKAQITV